MARANTNTDNAAPGVGATIETDAAPSAVVIRPTKPLTGVELANVRQRLHYLEIRLGVRFELIADNDNNE